METFKDIVNGDQPVLVDFYADWCGPCKVMAPVIEQLGKELQGKARVLKIDIDKNESLADDYRIQAVPTFMVFRKGEVVWRHSGIIEKSVLIRQIEES